MNNKRFLLGALLLIGAIELTACVADQGVAPMPTESSTDLVGDNYHPPHYPGDPERPADVSKCLNCHRPASSPPMPQQCTRCHNTYDPIDPHKGNYPMGPAPDLPSGDKPIPGYCLDCHRVEVPRPKDAVLTF